MRKRRLLLASLPALAWAQAAAAQSGEPTNITPDAAPPLSLGTTTNRVGNVTTIDGGTRAGPNLFHSFSRFDLGQGGIARWVHSGGNPATIANVVNRVTGGDPSNINGRIDSTAIPNADFWFINPAGVVFGQGAQVNVPAAAHFSTAQQLHFAAGPSFTVATPGGSTFSVASPAAFGFVGGQGAIVANGAGPLLARPGDLSLSAANVALRETIIDASSIRIAAVGAGSATIATTAPLPADLAGRIDIVGTAPASTPLGFDTRLSARGDGGIQLAAGVVTINRAALLAEPDSGLGPGIVVAARDSLVVQDARVLIENGTGTAGPLTLRSGGTLSILGNSEVATRTFATQPGTAAASGIIIEAPTIIIRGEASQAGGFALLGTTTSGTQRAGNLVLRGGSLEVANAFIGSFGQEADAGSILIDLTGDLLIDGADIDSRTIGLVPGVRSGDILVDARAIFLRNDARISANSFGGGVSGLIRLRADEIALDNSSIRSDVGGLGCEPCGDSNDAGAILIETDRLRLTGSEITADTLNPGRGGFVSVSARDAELVGSTISTNSRDAGDAGSITITAGDLRLLGESRITSAAMLGSTGNAGNVTIAGLGDGASRLLLGGNSAIRADTAGPGSGGAIRILSDDIVLQDGSEIASDSGRACSETGCGPLGAAGDIEIAARSLRLEAPDRQGGATVITSQGLGGGDAGTIRIRLSGDLDLVGQPGNPPMAGAAFISSSAAQTGRAGLIDVVAQNIRASGARTGFESSTFGSGQGGTIRLEARGIILIETEAIVASSTGDGRSLGSAPPGQGDGGEILLVARDIQLRSGGSVSAETFNDGDAGGITLRADRLHLDDGQVSSSTLATGRAGFIDIAVGALVMDGRSSIESQALNDCVGADCLPGGAAGNIVIDADRLVMTARHGGFEGVERPLISSSTATAGQGGDVAIAVDQLRVDGGVIGSATAASGDAGNVTIAARVIELGNGALITTSSEQTPGCASCPAPSGDAGDIGIVADDISVSGNSIITSSTSGSGDAGTVGIAADGRILLDHGHITTIVQDGSTGRSGIVAIEAGELVLLDGSIRTNSNSASEAGGILIQAPRVTLIGEEAAISSANGFDGVGSAGAIFMTTEQLSLLGGARLSTSSLNGAAGTIEIFMPETGLLVLQSQGTPSLITTSSGPGTGGRIFIARPLAIITNGGQILALGQEGGANVQIATDFFIRSADRFNRVAVDGAFLLEATVGDISSGTVNRDLSVIDASGVLRGQCASVRASGQVSQLVVRPIGPYGDGSAPPAPGTNAHPAGGCF